ncbi:hypothetical protein [Pseudoduganella sp. OTU4001]|uniref:hypothetical protein n=1 Tax=Pseudoduganella sp. OTU4001 TaxID=3043854 RepID=UPI00313F274A
MKLLQKGRDCVEVIPCAKARLAELIGIVGLHNISVGIAQEFEYAPTRQIGFLRNLVHSSPNQRRTAKHVVNEIVGFFITFNVEHVSLHSGSLMRGAGTEFDAEQRKKFPTLGWRRELEGITRGGLRGCR